MILLLSSLALSSHIRHNLSQSTTKPTEWPVLPVKTRIRLGPVWSVFTVRMKKHWVLGYPESASKDSDRTGKMPRLIWVFAGHTGQFVCFVVLRLNLSSTECHIFSGNFRKCWCFLLLSIIPALIFGPHSVQCNVQHNDILEGSQKHIVWISTVIRSWFK